MSNEEKHTKAEIKAKLGKLLNLRQEALTVGESLSMSINLHVMAAKKDDSTAEENTRAASHELLDRLMDLHIEMVAVGK